MYEYEGPVRYSECDETGRLTIVSMVNYLQDASMLQADELGIGLQWLRDERIGWILGAWEMRVGELPRCGERIRVRTWCHEMSRTHALRCFQMLREDGTEVVGAESQWFVFDGATGRVSRIPESQRAYLEDRPRLDLPPLERKLRCEGEGTPCEPLVVREQSLDTNGHVNNAQYILFAQQAIESLGREVPHGRIAVQYRRMAWLGETLVPVVHPADGGWTVCLRGDDREARAIVRLTGGER